MNSKDLAIGKAPAASSAPNPSASHQGSAAVGAPAVPTAFDQHCEMPDTYLKPRAVLLLKNPEWMFLFWDFDDGVRQRLSADGQSPQLRVLQDGREVFRTLLDLDGRRYYVKIPVGGGSIQAQLGLDRQGAFEPVLSSGIVAAPSARVSDDLAVKLAAPAWTGATPATLAGSQLLTEEQYAALFGDVPNDVPWYRQSTR